MNSPALTNQSLNYLRTHFSIVGFCRWYRTRNGGLVQQAGPQGILVSEKVGARRYAEKWYSYADAAEHLVLEPE